ncbi:hypothetical protein JKP88DRAFT_354479 [Tribonema minus]|uniref:Uncharacterized protein n=1 Tax=Tribonema minus TaxID=303371 RepID=A0A835Z8J2_9STRA|nr:hypothetical protein JKP88DRAFT_354479 [Tribonema minus]
MSNSGSSTHSRGGLAEELAEPVDVDAEAYRLGMRHNSEKILKASPAAAKKLYGDDSEAAIGEPTGSAAADVAAPQELERLEADQEAEESEYKAKGIVGKGWGKGFFGAGSQKTKKRPPQQQQQQPMPAPQQQPIEDAGAAAAIFRERISDGDHTPSQDDANDAINPAAVLAGAAAAAAAAPQETAASEPAAPPASAAAAAHTADSAADAPPPPPARAAHGGRERKSVSFDPVVREREIPARAPRPQSDAVNDMLRMFSEAVAETAEPLLEETELPPDVASPFGGMDAAALRAFRDRVYESGEGGWRGQRRGARGEGGWGRGQGQPMQRQQQQQQLQQQQQQPQAAPRMSKFKLRRLGLDPDAAV